ncbi:MAG: sulfatase-like hydrolase/transferase [Planctomycetaceae bacterium]|nr:sulfatase-like hydrolase/transferase [Planctomycetaceae bacterium]
MTIAGMAALFAAPAHAEAKPRPNFIVVFIDDMGYGDLSCYGNDRVETTNIDRLASEGIRFTQFYVASPICSPSRTGLTTGQYPQRWEITSFLAARAENRKRGMRQWLDPKAPTLPRILSEAGYATGHFGKWHMGGQRDVGEAPLISEYGFDESLTQFEGLGERVLATFDTLYQDNGGKRGLEIGSEKLDRGDVTWMKRYEITPAFVDRAIGFMKKTSQTDQPFYVNVWPDDVHSPHEPSPEHRGDGERLDMFDGVVKELDTQLGPLFEYVRNDPKLRDNTLILLASDNGPEAGVGSAGPFRGAKGNLYEGGIREPLIAWGPGILKSGQAGATNDVTVIAAMDVAPSLLSLAGVESPKDVTFDGVDMSEALTGAATPRREQPIFWARPPDRKGPMNSWPDLAVRLGDLKLLVDEDGSNAQLFDLASDPGESRDLSASRTDDVERLKAEVLAWKREVTPPKRRGRQQ